VVLDSLIPAIENPVLAVLFETDKYRILKNKLKERGKRYKHYEIVRYVTIFDSAYNSRAYFVSD
jgi:23S rRNA maturation-related 3'-5' exoribonuclease YhaM